MRGYQVLVLRIMVDSGSPESESRVRGSLQQVEQDERLAFANWQELRLLLEGLVREQRQKHQQDKEQ